MQVRNFEARTVTAAMHRVRAALGDDAIILATHETADGVRLTATVETEADLAGVLDPGRATAFRPVLEACIAHHRLPARLGEALLVEAMSAPALDPAAALTQALASRFRFVPLAFPTARPLAVVGLPGAGKSAMIARMAAQAVLGGHAATVLSTDAGRAGGVAQLTALLQPLQLAPVAAADPNALVRACGEAGGGSALLIDTAGLNPFRGREMAALAELLRASRAEPVLALPAGLDSADSIELVGNFAAIGVRRLLVTRVDTARRLGALLAVADIGVAFAGIGVGPMIGTGVTPLTAAGLARLLLHLAPAPNAQLAP